MCETKAPKIGDVVRLKSGSPAMTVVELIPEQNGITYVTCRWFAMDETEIIDVPSDALMIEPELDVSPGPLEAWVKPVGSDDWKHVTKDG
jgi:uncharacterized protein YodC (DUF2158 family)